MRSWLAEMRAGLRGVAIEVVALGAGVLVATVAALVVLALV